MNELIKELAREAGPTTIGEINTNIGNVHVINIERFAELIVRECIQLADQYGSGGAGSEFDMGYCSCANTLSEEFKKRFGVE